MDQIDKPLTFAIGLAVGIAASSITLYILSKEEEEESKKATDDTSKINKETQTIPLPEPKLHLDLLDGFPGTNGKFNSIEDDNDDDACTLRSPSPTNTFLSSATSLLPYYDADDNISFYRLYTEALDNLKSIQQPRVIRCKQMYCSSDQEFIAKVHCLRLAFAAIFDDDRHRQHFTNIGREILEMLSIDRSYDVKDCLKAYDSLIDYVSDSTNHADIRKELEARGIPCLSFYDIVLDYIILDSFDDLEDPPSSIMSVAQNSWMSSGFRESALRTAVGALLKMKRSRLMYEKGFFANFYSILDYILPVLIWGFFGSDQHLTLKCKLIKTSLLDAVKDYFNFDRARYTSLKDLSKDILRITEEHFDQLKADLVDIDI